MAIDDCNKEEWGGLTCLMKQDVKLSVLRRRGKNDLKSAEKIYSPCAGPMV